MKKKFDSFVTSALTSPLDFSFVEVREMTRVCQNFATIAALKNNVTQVINEIQVDLCLKIKFCVEWINVLSHKNIVWTKSNLKLFVFLYVVSSTQCFKS